MTPGAGSSELAPIFYAPVGPEIFRRIYRAAVQLGKLWPRQSSQQGQGHGAAAHLWGRFSAKRKNRGHKITGSIYGGAYGPPVAWGLWAEENRGLYSLEHGGAVIPPLYIVA